MYNIRNLLFRVFYSLVIDLETDKGKVRPASSKGVPDRETSPQPVVDDADGKLNYKQFFFFSGQYCGFYNLLAALKVVYFYFSGWNSAWSPVLAPF